MRPDDRPGAAIALAVAEDPVRLRPPFAVSRVAVALGFFRHHQLVAAEGALRLAARVRDALPQCEAAVDADRYPLAEHGMVAQGDGRDHREGGGQQRDGMAQRAPALATALTHHRVRGPGWARASTTRAASRGRADSASGSTKFELKAR